MLDWKAKYESAAMSANQSRAHYQGLVRRLEARNQHLEARVAELEAAAKPRPMSEAPRDCQFGAIVPLTYDRELSCERSDVCYLDREGDLWGLEGDGMVGMILGWLPLPDERKEGE